jgi:16S rRNA (adenine1518-N6/adenine1519-N6)-dimethyltransferase
MTLTDIKQTLESRRIQLTRSLGQNFLHDGNQLRRLIATAALTPEDRVLEIGPGLGALTELLLPQVKEILAIEMDQRLVTVLQERFASAKNLLLVHADALEYLRCTRKDWRGWKLVSNLPFSVASPLLIELAQMPSGPEHLTGTLQIEVAQRLMAQPSMSDYGILTLLVCLRYEPSEWFKIPAGCFFPAPNIDAAGIVLKRRKTALLPPDLEVRFTKIVKRAFSQRRKMMLKLLKQDWPVELLHASFDRVQLDPKIRAEAASLAQFVKLTELLCCGTA